MLVDWPQAILALRRAWSSKFKNIPDFLFILNSDSYFSLSIYGGSAKVIAMNSIPGALPLSYTECESLLLVDAALLERKLRICEILATCATELRLE